ncbi:Uncharacterized conserved protein, DUF427 family [Sulfitobacter marinus]|uniref:Uncharacterized conserved protein, DUF427 family n=1 Tax=Sulfitobacter marinus TaxID=394264 RepID=A0A1I6S4S3_9RHOB|nr:DUF427 domain-containing protein [Sulfitobacter marinus]SFS71894.1 Uncharacterized conserved protein, DUF427 family [Sulfitobacter marinus]
MSDHIKILKANGTWTVRAGGAVLAETKNALKLREGDRDEVIYIPRGDIAMAFLDKTDKITHCPHKGDATYYSVVTKSRTLQNVAWSYENPSDQVAEIKGHLAFYNMPEVTVEQI